jgi:hypothetical protein
MLEALEAVATGIGQCRWILGMILGALLFRLMSLGRVSKTIWVLALCCFPAAVQAQRVTFQPQDAENYDPPWVQYMNGVLSPSTDLWKLGDYYFGRLFLPEIDPETEETTWHYADVRVYTSTWEMSLDGAVYTGGTWSQPSSPAANQYVVLGGGAGWSVVVSGPLWWGDLGDGTPDEPDPPYNPPDEAEIGPVDKRAAFSDFKPQKPPSGSEVWSNLEWVVDWNPFPRMYITVPFSKLQDPKYRPYFELAREVLLWIMTAAFGMAVIDIFYQRV